MILYMVSSSHIRLIIQFKKTREQVESEERRNLCQEATRVHSTNMRQEGNDAGIGCQDSKEVAAQHANAKNTL